MDGKILLKTLSRAVSRPHSLLQAIGIWTKLGAIPWRAIVARLRTDGAGATHAMVQGEFRLAHALVRKLQQIGIVCVAATTHREVVEQSEGTKTTRFNFVRFREYS